MMKKKYEKPQIIIEEYELENLAEKTSQSDGSFIDTGLDEIGL